MALDKSADKVIETDVLVVGGGIGGCAAGVKAREQRLRVTMIEKGVVIPDRVLTTSVCCSHVTAYQSSNLHNFIAAGNRQ